MAYTKAVALLLVLTLSSALARPLSGRQLLQSSTSNTVTTTALTDFTAFQTAVATNDPSKIAAAFTQLTQTASPELQQKAVTTALTATKGTPSTQVLAAGLANAAGSSPSVSTAVGNAVAGATGTPPTGQTGGGASSSVLVEAFNNGPGVQNAEGKVISDANATSINAISSAIATAISEVSTVPVTQEKITASAAAASKAVGTACATAITSVTAVSSSNSAGGTAKVQGQATAESYASAWSAAFAEAFAKASNGRDQAVAAVKTGAFTESFARAVSTSAVSLSTQGAGNTAVNVTTISQSIQEAVSQAFASALAFVGASQCSNCGSATAPSTTTGR